MYSKIDKIGSKYNHLQTDIWLHHDLFSLGWWGIVIVNCLFLIMFIFLIHRSRLLLISFVFVVNFVIVGLGNEIGSFMIIGVIPTSLLFLLIDLMR